ncbi:type I polyketide synthase [Tengunoibacter tsumagoiensis]|uniref:Polyketide synthase n=1 Tax=Tengunoibacter tsumagoiensis TaxID=2014871 RepID=A0A402A9F9_9CHLR|nr:type I polyketide synthase [Tengunoibacter tsumagoiensis]GCE15780.1 polyketide synthase [Tengunoibacter tsumagoiensis]
MVAEIAIVGMACRYPQANSPVELWENILAQRRAFRRIPAERLQLDDYFSSDRSTPDSTYATQGAFLDHYTFDRVRFRISGNAYRSSDLAHWLALDVASQALSDAGFVSPDQFPRATTGVIVGNTLTGEFSRAHSLRLRWPYVRRVLASALQTEGWSAEHLEAFLSQLEVTYKEPFAPVGEETLAGGLSNTIAGRICNYFDFKGGGYTVDGACSSSLLAVATACNALAQGELDLALAGGVDLSLDPFEIIGFAKTAALAQDEMRVYDLHSAGFFPGEGCGFVTLMRYEDALAQQRRVYALIRGWGISSDGAGGITRPDVEGQLLALQRAYQKAQIPSETVTYFEGHGTGTAVGDTTELQTLTRLRRQSRRDVPSAVIGSIKANIGHTKAAAGVAGLIKATMAVSTQILPPHTGISTPHTELRGPDAALQLLHSAQVWPADQPLRAGVSSMGFGGINAHIVLEGVAYHRRTALTIKERQLNASVQDAELFLLAGANHGDLHTQVEQLLTFSARLSLAELTDLAITLAKQSPQGSVRAAIVASRPAELTERLEKLRVILQEGDTAYFAPQDGLFLGEGSQKPRIGLLFPGQGAPAYLSGGLLRRRFAEVDRLYQQVNLPSGDNETDTRIAQPAIVTSSLAALKILQQVGITATVAAGHSLGELTAFHWAGAMDEQQLVELARVRGEAMGTLGKPTGVMVSLKATQHQVSALIGDAAVVIASINAPRQIVISGEESEVNRVVERAKQQKIACVPLAVSHAFHSPHVAAAAEPLAAYLRKHPLHPLERSVFSTVTGALLNENDDLSAILYRQITEPVQFVSAVTQAASHVDLFIEVGPGKILSGLAAQSTTVPVLPINAGSPSLEELLKVIGATFVLGQPLSYDLLFTQRFHRPFNLNWEPAFLVNPCELAPQFQTESLTVRLDQPESEPQAAPVALQAQRSDVSSSDFIKQLIAQRIELPLSAIQDHSRLLSDLHLNSITVGQVVSEAWRAFDLLPPVAPTEYANATIAEVAQALEETQKTGGTVALAEKMSLPSGVDTWVRPFEVIYQQEALPETTLSMEAGSWKVVTEAGFPHDAALRQLVSSLPGSGLLLCLNPERQSAQIGLVLQAAQEFFQQEQIQFFVLVQQGRGCAGFVRTLHLEAPKKTACVLDLPIQHPQASEWLRRELQAARGYSEAIYQDDGTRFVPRLQLLSLLAEKRPEELLCDTDVLLVTGGGKGIAAEAAFALAQQTGVRLLLLGRSDPEQDSALAENLRRLVALEIQFLYQRVDVTDARVVKEAIQRAEQTLGPITAVLHGAGANIPQLISAQQEANIQATLQPKIQGLQHVLDALDKQRLKLLVTFGSVIARTGMRGEADYALANDWLAFATEEFQRQYPDCRSLCIEWSVWSGIGMGERLGKVEALLREGIQPISTDEGLAAFQNLLVSQTPVRVVVSGRFGETPTLRMVETELPLLRFLEEPRVFYPGIELIVDATLSTSTDPYVEDHRYRGERLLPAVVGLEAMAQVARAVTGKQELPTFTNVLLLRPIVVQERATVVIRISALVHASGRVDVTLRSEDTAFQVNHFSASCHFAPHTALIGHLSLSTEQEVELSPEKDLYGRILFHQGRFQRVSRYHLLQARACVAEITPLTGKPWYVQYLPGEHILGDAAARDALIHCIQACIPYATLLPVGIESIRVNNVVSERHFVLAQERFREGDIFHYDVEVRSIAGEIIEQWSDLQLRQVDILPDPEAWPPALLGPYLERKMEEMLHKDTTLRILVQSAHSEERRRQSELALGALLRTPIYHRADGKPLLIDREAPTISTAHCQAITLAVTCAAEVGCDIESISARSASIWHDLLGEEGYQLASHLSTQGDEELDSLATRVWTVHESLKKAGAMVKTPVLFQTTYDSGWYLFTAGTFQIATYRTMISGLTAPIIVAICVREPAE